MKPVLRTMADGVPMLVAAVEAIDQWAASNPSLDEPPPPIVEAVHVRYRDVELHTVARTYSLWMVQRPLDAYRALAEDQRAAVDRAIEGTGWEPLLALRPRQRVKRSPYQLAWDV